MSKFQPRLVETLHYHLWTDALHMRAIAHQAQNRWDRGTYVRCVWSTACATLEMACNDALGVSDIGYSFRKNLDHAIQLKGSPQLDWSHGVWKEVTELLALRKESLHQGISNKNRFAEARQADRAIDGCRRAIKAIYAHVGKGPPTWVDDDSDPGFASEKSIGYIQANHGADPNHPDTVRIAYVYKDREHTSDYLPPRTDHKPFLDNLIVRTRIPISAVRAYRGSTLLEERVLMMRGN